jgi:hypothetical protein
LSENLFGVGVSNNIGKVKIAYTVDFEDIPREVDGILNRAHAFLTDASLIFKEIPMNETGNGIDDTLLIIEKIRKQLSRADHALDDADAILKGYLSTKMSMSDPSPSTEKGE